VEILTTGKDEGERFVRTLKKKITKKTKQKRRKISM